MTDERDPLPDLDAIIDGTPPTIEETTDETTPRGAVRTHRLSGGGPPSLALSFCRP